MADQSHLPTDVVTEFYIDGAWTSSSGGEDLAARVRGEDQIRITRGLVDQQSAPSPVQAQFSLNNRDGLFTDDNPSSPLFGKFGQNTLMRTGIQDSSGGWDEYLALSNGGTGLDVQYATTADKASLDITGDIDVRVELECDLTRTANQIIMGKYSDTGAQASWLLALVDSGTINLIWTPDGSTLKIVNSGTYKIDKTRRRFAFKVTLDVNNGSGGVTVTFSDADTIAGPYTQHSVFSGLTTSSIFSGTAALTIGAAAGGTVPFAGNTAFSGKVYAAEVRNGIGGTLVADFKPYGRGVDEGAISWADTCSSPNTWALTNCRLGSDRIRFSGEMNSIPTTWDVTGQDIWVPSSASGLLQRLASSGSVLAGAIYRTYRNEPAVYAWWPMEDQAGSTQIATGNASPNGLPGAFDSVTFGAPTGLDGATGCATLTDGSQVSSIRLRTAGPLSYTGTTSFLFYFKMATLPATDNLLFRGYISGGSASRWDVTVGASTYTFTAYDKDNNILDNSGSIGFGVSPLDQWVGMQLKCTQSGGNVQWDTLWHAVGSNTFYTHHLGGDTFSGTVGMFSGAFIQADDSAQANEQVAHVMFRNDSFTLANSTFANASKAYAGETAGLRIARLAAEEGIACEWVGNLNDTEAVGPQTAESVYTNWTTAAGADGGLLSEPRDARGIKYVTRRALGLTRHLELDYAQSHLAATPIPVRDSRYLVNDFTANRPSGSSARYEANDGRRLNVNDPPTGAGRVEQSGSVNVAGDDQLPGQAQFKVFLGTWEERRVPNLAIALSRPEIFTDDALLAAAISHDMGDQVSLTGTDQVVAMPPDDRLDVTFGYTETIDGFTWNQVQNTVPAGPYLTPIIDDPDDEDPRLDASGNTVLDGDHDSTTTTISIKTPDDEPAWVDSTDWSAEFPFDAKITGEVMTVTAATAPSASGGFNLQDLTVTRSVNGVVKAHDDGEPVYLAVPSYLGMGS